MHVLKITSGGTKDMREIRVRTEEEINDNFLGKMAGALVGLY